MSETFSTLTRELKRRAARAYVSNFTVRSKTLRKSLLTSLDGALGQPDSLLAPPVFEAMFGWQPSATTLDAFASPPLQRRLIDSLDAPPKGYEEQRFERGWYPHSHQAEAWRLLLQKDPASVVVSSGTGSGKTECFLIPILNSLASEATGPEPLRGVRALLLYPLNALINSQRQRLRAWTGGLGGRVRFCLYNGNTPREVKAELQRQAGPEVLDRKSLRASPPPILVTNATMLEYMLVRAEDQPILQASQGQLRWVVLDEAHTYLGSHAAELALLIRRVLMAFGVEASQVRFVATSATIGKRGDVEVKAQLRKYLSRVGGIPESHVHVVEGVPRIPALPSTTGVLSGSLPVLDVDGDDLYQRMLKSEPARAVRKRLCDGPAPLVELVKAAADAGSEPPAPEGMIAFLDAATRAAPADKSDAFLRLRGHFFERVPGGLWACCNGACIGRPASQNDDWRWGKVLHHRLSTCDACGSRVFEIGFCRGCGESFLIAAEVEIEGKRRLTTRAVEEREFEDEVELELSQGEEEGQAAGDQAPSSGQRPRLLSRGTFAESTVFIRSSISPKTGEFVEGGQSIGVVVAEDRRFRCPCCSANEKAPGEGFGPFRIGQAFALGVALPALLEQAPPEKRNQDVLPSSGRRLITFTDSRQGTAMLALRAQLDAQRNVTRSFIYHELWERASPPSAARIEELTKVVETLRGYVVAAPTLAATLSQNEMALERARRGTPGYATIKDLVDAWAANNMGGTDQALLTEDISRQTGGAIDGPQVPRFLIAREFLRRPMRANSMETMGLASLRYPHIEALHEAPPRVAALGVTVSEWKEILKLFLDFFVRANGGVALNDDWTRWMGDRVVVKWIAGPGEDVQSGSRKVRWPSSTGMSRLARMIKLTITDDQIDRQMLFEEAWEALLPLLTASDQGFHFDLLKHGALEVRTSAWLCPLTRRVIDTTLRGTTPYLPADATPATRDRWTCKALSLPTLPFPKRRDRTAAGRLVELEKMLDWLETDPVVRELREVGVWGEFSDRIAARASYARIAEHSAQVGHRDLQRLEARFVEGKINVLSCSTTMEMGVDIGGVSIVGMNNAPPGPSNFLQRAGRAGRRGEPTAVSFTLCQDQPHAREVFRRPMWPFVTPIHVPDVTLNSERIVQRHLNALLLGRFLATFVDDPVRLKAGAFFDAQGAGLPHDLGFGVWLEKMLCAPEVIQADVANLVRYSSLEGTSVGQMLSAAGAALADIGNAWRARLAAYLAGPAFEEATQKNSIAARAAEHHLRRLRGEYLLKFLTTERFLPGHGFPTLVVPFVNTAIEDLKPKPKSDDDDDDDDETGASYADYASRTLSIALREYAPGNGVVMSGKVYKAAGLSLHWQRPPDETAVGESQELRFAWRCRSCGASGTRDGLVTQCPACSGSDTTSNRYLQPSGMAVDIRSKPTNDLSSRKFLPADAPLISTSGAAWTSLPRPELGRFRYTASGSIFHRSRGEFGAGYALCLHCGRADSEGPRIDGPAPKFIASDLPSTLKDHQRLRGGRENGTSNQGKEVCSGVDNPWAIQRNLWLGVEETTDIFELQVATPGADRFLSDKATAAAIAVALRTALAEQIGLEEREIGFAVIPALGLDEQRCVSIVLYDAVAGGAGFVAAATSHLPAILQRAHKILCCLDQHCDAACHSCLLGYDTARVAPDLNRHSALKVINTAFVDSLDLPVPLRLFGEASSYEFHSLNEAMSRELGRRDVKRARVHLTGDPADWDLSQEWSLRRQLLRWCADGLHVAVGIDSATAAKVSVETKATLRALKAACTGAAEMGGGSFEVLLTTGEPSRSLVTLGGASRTTSWSATAPEAGTPGASWGAAGQLIRGDWNQALLPLLGEPLDVSPVVKVGFVEVAIGTEVEGAIGDFGVRFWKRILEARPELAARLGQYAPLKRVTFRDRYLRSPLNVRLAFETLRALQEKPGGIKQGSTVIIVEAATGGKDGNATLLKHDWGSSFRAEAITKRVFATIAGEFTSKKTSMTTHHREILLEWNDGKSAVVRPDQGVGFVETNRTEPFDFYAGDSAQAAALLSRKFSVVKRDTAPVMVYVGGLQ
jgi:DEAD/DEAH box helicase domain-containing protein